MTERVINVSFLQKYLVTISDARDFQLVLQNLCDKFFETEERSAVILKKEAPYSLAEFLTKVASEYKVNMEDKTQVQLFLRQLDKAISEMTVVSLTLAIDPKETFIKAMQDWFMQQYKKLVLLDISVDQSIIAGSIIQIHGKYHDYSLRKTLEETTIQNV